MPQSKHTADISFRQSSFVLPPWRRVSRCHSTTWNRLFNHPKSPYILACTATWLQDWRDFFHQITGIDLQPKNIVRAPISAFCQCNICLHLHFTEEPIHIVPKTVVKFLNQNQANSFVVFVNSKHNGILIHNATENKIDANDYEFDVVIIQGDLFKVTKFYRCRAFCDEGIWDRYDKGRVVGCFGYLLY